MLGPLFDNGQRRGKIASDLMYIAPGPLISRHDRAHDWVLRVMEVLCGVPSGRRVATTDVATRQAFSKRYPRSSLFNAFFAKVLRPGRRKAVFGKILEMLTWSIHIFAPLFTLGSAKLALFEVLEG
jgi:hypothetical protein